MNYDKLSSDDIREIHEVALQRYGGLYGENEPGMIDFMAEKPFTISFGQELYPGLFMKAAIYMEGFAIHQYFSDGNKRTACMVAATFLEINGYSLIVNDNELYDISIGVANKEVTINVLTKWLEKNSQSNT